MRLFRRKQRRHAAKPVPQVEGVRSPVLTRRIASPWSIIALYVLNIAVLVLIMMLFGYQSRFSDYLNQRGEFRDRQAQEQQMYLCELITHLRADPEGQLQELATRLGCDEGPLPPRAEGDNGPTPSAVPIAPNGGFFTGSPTPGSQTATGTVARGNGGRESPTRAEGPSATTSAPRTTATASPPRASSAPPTTTSPVVGGAPSSPAPPSGGGGITLCVPFTHICT